MWPFVVFCDLSVFLHDGLWCKVQLLWILPYFVVFVTIMAFKANLHEEDIGELGRIHLSGWWFQTFFIFTPICGEDSHFD